MHYENRQTDTQHKSRPIHEKHQSCEQTWQNSEDEKDRHINGVNIKSLRFNNIQSSIIRKLETGNRQRREKT